MATALSLGCAALTSAAPSARGGVRPLTAGRRGVGFTLSTAMMAPPSKPKQVTAFAQAKPTDLPWDGYKGDEDEVKKEVDEHYAELCKEIEFFRSYEDEDDEFDKYFVALCKQTEEAMTGRFVLLPLEIPFELSEEENALQNKLKEITERCMDLLADAVRRLRPEQRRPLYLVFRTTHLALTSVKVTAMEGRANLGVSSLLIAHKLDVVRKMVSSACSAPLPLEEISLLEESIGGLGGVDRNSQDVVFALIEDTYNTVKSDIDKISDREVILVTKLEQFRAGIPTPMRPEEQTNLTAAESEMLSALREIAGRGYLLVKDVANRTRPKPESSLFISLYALGKDFLGLKNFTYFPEGVSAILFTRFDIVRRTVSLACDAPLPALTTHPDESAVVDYSRDEEMLYMVKTFCDTVEADVKNMIFDNKN